MANDLRFTIELDGVQKTITSVSDANKVIRELTKNFVLAKESGKDLTATMSQLNKALEVKQSLLMVSKGAVELKTNMAGAQTASANASMALLNLNYVIRDSPYFFNNFALGLLAVGNNINPLIDSFNRLRQEAVGKSISTFQLLKQALVGGAGISIAFSLVVTAIQSFVFWQSRASRESEKHTDKLRKEKEEVSRLRGEYNSLVREREMRMSEDTSPTRLTELQITAGQMRAGIREKKQEIKLYRKDSINYKEAADFIRQEEANLRLIENELNYIIFAWQNVVNENEKDNKVLKEKVSLLKAAKMLQPDFGGGVGATARRGFYAGEQTNKRFGMRQAERTKAFGFGGMVKDLGIDLEMGKIAAQELGNALSSAFEQGTIKLNEFIQSLGLAIFKMILLKGIMGFLSGDLFGAASAMTPSAATGGLGNLVTSGFGDATRFKKSVNTVQVQGRISANKNKFIVEIENARDYYNNNERLITIGRD